MRKNVFYHRNMDSRMDHQIHYSGCKEKLPVVRELDAPPSLVQKRHRHVKQTVPS